ncbi:MAG: SDR family NAD(P)-dependent oxidoreductase, partial [Rhodococcus sp. (in: high G+C Gram-positive bacteria)]
MSPTAIPGVRLDDRVAFVTGAARGMGAAHARTLASRGADLIIADLDTAELSAVAKEIRGSTGRRVECLELDVTAPDAGERVVAVANDSFGRLDILVHNAGIMHDWKTLGDTPVENLRPYLDVNVLG